MSHPGDGKQMGRAGHGENEGFISVFSDFDWSDDSNIRNHYNILNYIKLIDVILYTSTNDY